MNELIEELWNSEEVKKLQENYIKYLVTEERLDGEDIDKDRCSYAWKNLYKEHYENREFWKKTCFNYNNVENKRKYEIFFGESSCRISGDLLFNFKSEKDGAKGKGKKYEHYESLIKNESDFDEEKKDLYLEILEFCNQMNYTLHNFGLMPVDGNLQIFKENVCNMDRVDMFIYWIDSYFTRKDDKLFSRIMSTYRDEEQRKNDKNEKKKTLELFLAKFQNVYNYCKEMYLISEDFVERLLDSGKEEIKCGKDVVRYMELAIEYWILKDKILNEEIIIE